MILRSMSSCCACILRCNASAALSAACWFFRTFALSWHLRKQGAFTRQSAYAACEHRGAELTARARPTARMAARCGGRYLTLCRVQLCKQGVLELGKTRMHEMQLLLLGLVYRIRHLRRIDALLRPVRRHTQDTQSRFWPAHHPKQTVDVKHHTRACAETLSAAPAPFCSRCHRRQQARTGRQRHACWTCAFL